MSNQKFTLTGPNESVINILSQNRPMLISALNKIIEESEVKESYYLKLERADCKCEHVYNTEKDIPEGNHTCQHGNFFIFYTDSNQQ